MIISIRPVFARTRQSKVTLDSTLQILITVQKKAMFQTKVCTKVGNSLFLNLVMIRKWTLFSVKMVNFQNAEMKLVFSLLGFKSKNMCLRELGDNGYECNKQYYQMKANSPFKILNVSNKHLHFILHKRF